MIKNQAGNKTDNWMASEVTVRSYNKECVDSGTQSRKLGAYAYHMAPVGALI